MIVWYHMTSHDHTQLPLDINNVLHELNKKELLTKHKIGSRKSKRIKLDTPTEEEISLDKSWQRVGIILDAVPGCVSSQECYQLVPILFELLERYGMEIAIWNV